MERMSDARIIGEIEYEFGSEGNLVVSRSIAETIVQCLKKGDVERASLLYQGAPSGTADDVIKETSTLSRKVMERLMNMFALARDFPHAAACAKLMKDAPKTADFLESAAMFEAAATLYKSEGDLEKAALLYEKAGNNERAAELFLKAGNEARALTNLQRLGKLLDAGKLCLKMKRTPEAIKMLTQALEREESDAEAALLLATIFQSGGKRRQAMEFCLKVIRRRSTARKTLPLYAKLLELLLDERMIQEAQKVLTAAIQVFPESREIRVLAEKIQRASVAPGKAPDLLAEKEEEDIVYVDDVLVFLQRLPLFTHLSMEELGALRDISVAGRVKAGDVVIRQGEEGQGLFIVMEGEVDVVLGEGRAVKTLMSLGPSTSFGEVSLLDDAPTSAAVVARADTKLLLVRKSDFRDFLFTSDKVASGFYRTIACMLASRLRAANETIASLRPSN